MGILSWVIFGLIAGALAKFVMPGKDPGGCIVTSILGIVGAVIGGFIATRLGMGTVQGFDLRSFGIAVAGAILVLLVYRMFRSK
ncbi:MAG TPA: GlsB/YeaQ/YmgE family stress response membrane protein [Thermoanaerobaculia bacterium]|nr:GlsB/YeaQ/YmgE family stress response membrane protein [Thermoanaerobaculia bacterium]